jgi:hypothetical protein
MACLLSETAGKDQLLQVTTNESARSVLDNDGGVILNLRTGRIFRLNQVGSLVWAFLVQADSLVSVARIVDAIHGKFANISRERVERDVRRFLEQLNFLGLISSNSRVVARNEPPAAPLITETMQPAEAKPTGQDVKELRDASVKPSANPSLFLSLVALAALLICDVALICGGFPFLHFLLSKCPLRHRRHTREEDVSRICASVNAACSWYLKRTLCLQRTFAGTVLLRLCGVPATAVIGASILPFQSHAWIEVNGKVINDKEVVQRSYKVLERC